MTPSDWIGLAATIIAIPSAVVATKALIDLLRQRKEKQT